ncbi:MAG: VWA domain-containing protein [Bdellovibrionota bacterium]
MRLKYWPFLLILILIPILHRWWSARNSPARVNFSIPLPPSLGMRSPVKWLLLVRYIAMGFLIFSLSRPQSSFRETQRQTSGLDIMMVMDVSASMDIEDLAERSRFSVAKDTMEEFIKGRQSDRIGFVIFSGEPLTLAPPTLDYGLVLRSLRESRIGLLKDGTAIGDGLSIAVGHLRNSKAKSRVIVLLTDGDNNLGQVDPATAGELAAGYGIRVYTIAIGKEGRVRLPIRSKGLLGNEIVRYQYFENALNPELLQYIAKITSGKFYRVTDESALESVFHEIDGLEKSEMKSNEKVRFEEKYQGPLKLGFVALVLEQLLARGWWRIIP